MAGPGSVLVILILGSVFGVSPEEFAAVPWNSPLSGHIMNVVCPMQDDFLQRMDLSSLYYPAWLRQDIPLTTLEELLTHEDPVGRCPVRYDQLTDTKRIWPTLLVSVVCACERSRCTSRGSHVCITVYVTRMVLKNNIGFTKELLSVDCICAAKSAKIVKFTRSQIVS